MPPAPPCWREDDTIEDDVKNFVEMKAESRVAGHASPSSNSSLKVTDCASWEEAPNPKCFASFGDQGTTATVGAFGQLLQFSDFLGAGSSGMFSVDHSGVDEPYQVMSRAEHLHERMQEPFHFGQEPQSDPPYGLRFPGLVLEPSAQPKLSWMNWRWPRYEYSRGRFQGHPELKLTIQWMVHGKAVLQRCLLDNNGKDFQLDVQFGKSMQIRDLDHLDRFLEFNDGNLRHHHDWRGPEGYSWVCVHEFPHTDTEDKQQSPDCYGVSVTSSVAIDGKVQSFDNDVSSQLWSLPCKDRQPGENGTTPPPVEVITAYKLTLLKRPQSSWRIHIIPWHQMEIIRSLGEHETAARLTSVYSSPAGPSISAPVGFPDKSPSLRLSPDFPRGHLNFAARRNLEHILSVCAIRTTGKTDANTTARPLPAALNRVKEEFALTCGDMSGHRVCWSASFFAFRFLVESYRVLDTRKEPRNSALLCRIREVCLGHLKWLHVVQRQTDGQTFGTNYSVTGRLTSRPHGSQAWVAGPSLLDTGFQILKLAAATELWDDRRLAAGVTAELMSEWAPSWLISLKNADKREKYAWPQAEKEGVDSFRLDEHVWIWQALKSLEMNDDQAWDSMLDKCRKNQIALPAGKKDWEEELGRLRIVFSSDTVRCEVSKRFTIENTILRKRMLATTRSAKESRFMLHARDTALLYEEPFDFLGKDSSTKELWRATIQSQIHHADPMESNAEKTLRYALNIKLGARKLTINDTPPDDLVRTAMTILIRASSPNGLFPGRIESSTKEPVSVSEIEEEDLESYYHASFEIPYILFTHEEDLSEAHERLKRRNPDSMLRAEAPRMESKPQLTPAQLDNSLVQGDAEQRQMLLRVQDLLLSKLTVPDPANRQISMGIRRTVTKAVPFDKLIDSSNIVRLEDEWLYKYPDFLSRGEDLEIVSDREGLADIRSVLNLSNASSVLTPLVLDESIDRDLQFCIVDVQSFKRVSRKQGKAPPTYCDKFEDLQKILQKPRTAEISKKRLLHFQRIPSQVALHCFATTEESERPYLKDFFERHARSAKQRIDNCSMIQNAWESEFHLSYYQLVPKSSYSRKGSIVMPEDDDFPGRPGLSVVRVAAGFRFNGDLFDRHWTCYMLDSTLKGQITNPLLLKQREYCQRKVLEQQYFFDILKSLNGSVGEILREVKRSLRVESGSFSTSIHTANEYLSWNELWQGFEPLLQKLNDDLVSTQAVVKQWNAREDDRGKEKPRWTPADERKYRAIIMRIERQVKRQMGHLQDLHETTKSLQALFTPLLNKAREDLNFRSDQNIALFTYVTVVFLPLGFAASIFSMNGVPERSLTINLVIASAIALAATIVALMNAKALVSVVERGTDKFEKFTRRVKKSSAMMRDLDKQGNQDQTSTAGRPNIELAPGRPLVGGSYLVFWVGYVFIEVPARTITSACRALGWSREAPGQAKMRVALRIPNMSRLLFEGLRTTRPLRGCATVLATRIPSAHMVLMTPLPSHHSTVYIKASRSLPAS